MGVIGAGRGLGVNCLGVFDWRYKCLNGVELLVQLLANWNCVNSIFGYRLQSLTVFLSVWE